MNEFSIALSAAQCARIALTIAQNCQSLIWVEPTDKREYIALHRAGDPSPMMYIDRDGMSYDRMPFNSQSAH